MRPLSRSLYGVQLHSEDHTERFRDGRISLANFYWRGGPPPLRRELTQGDRGQGRAQ